MMETGGALTFVADGDRTVVGWQWQCARSVGAGCWGFFGPIGAAGSTSARPA